MAMVVVVVALTVDNSFYFCINKTRHISENLLPSRSLFYSFLVVDRDAGAGLVVVVAPGAAAP